MYIAAQDSAAAENEETRRVTTRSFQDDAFPVLGQTIAFYGVCVVVYLGGHLPSDDTQPLKPFLDCLVHHALLVHVFFK